MEENLKNKCNWESTKKNGEYLERKISSNSDDTTTSVDASDSGVDFVASSYIMDSGISSNILDPDIDNEVLQELQYSEDEDEEPEGCLEISTEENFLKSSTSVSGDDEGAEASYFGRPRSVHFEDEHWKDGEYRIKNTQDIEYSSSWNNARQAYRTEKHANSDHNDSWVNGEKSYRKHELQPLHKNVSDLEPFHKTPAPTTAGRPHNVKSANRESVRELLRRKREVTV